VIYSTIDNPDNPIKEEYINEYGHIIHHKEGNDIIESYTTFGKAGDIVTAKALGDFYASIVSPSQSFDLFLSQAYKQGLRLAEPPETDEIDLVFNVKTERLLVIECVNDFYGFGKPLLLDMTSQDFSKRVIHNNLVLGLIAYRWFFNKPDLNFSYKMAEESLPLTSDMQQILDHLFIDRLNEKWKRRVSRGSCFKPSKKDKK